MISAVGIVVPVRDEERLLGACLESLDVAAREVERRRIHVALAVVLDSCSDGSESIAERAARRRPVADVVRVSAANVGVARAIGLQLVLGRLAGHDPAATWVATTDADSNVPTSWLVDQLERADRGADVVAGIVQVRDWHDRSPLVRQRFLAQYTIRPDGTHDHVHGANLGFRASACLAAGGIPSLALAEDHALLEAIACTGARVEHTSSIVVTTSARRVARAANGFSTLLTGLAAAPSDA